MAKLAAAIGIALAVVVFSWILWPSRRARGPVPFRAPRIEFLGPQDGFPEQDLKRALGEMLASRDLVRAAYLLRVRYPETADESVVLALDAEGSQQPELVPDLSELFAARFTHSEHLDILFLVPSQLAQVRKVCAPFYERLHRP